MTAWCVSGGGHGEEEKDEVEWQVAREEGMGLAK